MKNKPNPSAAAAKLRRRAEVQLRERRNNQRSKSGEQKSDANTQRLLHELQVHQIELEMQNAELQEARDRTETLLEKYTDLYDFAPVGYFSLDEQGRILEVNLTGAALLGVERSRFLNQPLQRFMDPMSRPIFLAFLEQVFAVPRKQICEAKLLKKDGACFWANLHGISAISVSGPRRWCRVAVSDITTLKQAEEAQSRMEALAAANHELRREIVRRQAVEESLKKSQQHQSQLVTQLRYEQEQLRHLSHQILQVQEEERKHISRELHDEISQILVGINVHLETLARDATVNPRRLRQKIARTQRLVEKSVDRVHQFARDLRPTALDDLGLTATLHSFLTDFMKRTGIRVHFTTFASRRIDTLDSDIRTVLYRIAQEALTNVARHAQATRVELSLQKLNGVLLMQIKDDGKSFEVEQVLHAKRNKRLGLVGMRERVEMVGGSFSITSAPGLGTTIRAEIPFNNRTARRGGGADRTF